MANVSSRYFLTDFQVRFKDSINDVDFQKAIDQVKSAGGKIVHEHTLFKGFTASLPSDHVTALSAHPELDGIEKDQEVHTQ